MRYLNNKLIPPELRLKSGHDPFLVPIGVRVYVPGVRPYYGCTEGYNGPITAGQTTTTWISSSPDLTRTMRTMQLQVVRTNALLWVTLGIEKDTR